MNQSKPIAIIKTGSTFPQISAHYGDFEAWIHRGLGSVTDVMVIDAEQGGRFLPWASWRAWSLPVPTPWSPIRRHGCGR
ncbi:hypothetical protein ACMG4L_12165 [Alcanivorax sp. IL1]|uniref:hypothetical protein n=1 Tax=Alcanivorax sp. IL1 TaxID=3396308 RepID=UPI0039C1E781